jgi:hypothetical protein
MYTTQVEKRNQKKHPTVLLLASCCNHLLEEFPMTLSCKIKIKGKTITL